MQAIKDIFDLMTANFHSITTSLSNSSVQDRFLSNPKLAAGPLWILFLGAFSILFRKWLGEYLTFYKGWVALVFGTFLIIMGVFGFMIVLSMPQP